MDKRTIIFVICFSVTLFAVNLFFTMRNEKEAIEWNKQQAAKQVKEQQELATENTKRQAFEAEAKQKQNVLTNQQQSETFYVLENEYQQLVFSNRGGALAEINLPFNGPASPNSPVREIDIDRRMQKEYPYNDYFPAASLYYTPGPKGTPVEQKSGKLGGYYPLLRRTLVQANDNRVNIEPRLYSLNIVSKYPEVAQLIYEVKQFDSQTIVFEAVQPLRRITKTYSIAQQSNGAPYCIDLNITVEGDSRGLFLTSGIPEVEMISGSPAPQLQVRIVRNQESDVEKLDFPKEGSPLVTSSVHPSWVCNSNGFFGIILNPLDDIGAGYNAEMVPGNIAPSRFLDIDTQYNLYKASELPGYLFSLPLRTTGGQMHFRIFAGPSSDHILKAVDATFTDPVTGQNPDYIASQSFHGWFAFISEPFAKLLFIIMKFFHSVTGSWALSIFLLTVVLRILLYPLNTWSFKAMRRMQQIAPEVSAIQAKYKKDPKKSQIEIMNLYRQKKVNPFSGCVPLLIQMPFLIGMFDLLKSTFDLRGASFIPGWIDNLTAPDVLFQWSYPLFFIGTQFHLLPILLGVVMYLQQRYSSTALPKDKTLWTDQQKQQRLMGNMMVGLFAIMFYHFPSGLNIYWLSSMLLGILQQWITNKQVDKQGSVPSNTILVKGKKKPVK